MVHGASVSEIVDATAPRTGGTVSLYDDADDFLPGIENRPTAVAWDCCAGNHRMVSVVMFD